MYWEATYCIWNRSHVVIQVLENSDVEVPFLGFYQIPKLYYTQDNILIVSEDLFSFLSIS